LCRPSSVTEEYVCRWLAGDADEEVAKATSAAKAKRRRGGGGEKAAM